MALTLRFWGRESLQGALKRAYNLIWKNLEGGGNEAVTELLTIDETAALLKLSDWTVHQMLLAWVAKSGELAEGTDFKDKDTK